MGEHMLFYNGHIKIMQNTPVKRAAERLRIDVAARANAEARFNAPPHQSELN